MRAQRAFLHIGIVGPASKLPRQCDGVGAIAFSGEASLARVELGESLLARAQHLEKIEGTQPHFDQERIAIKRARKRDALRVASGQGAAVFADIGFVGRPTD